MKANFIGRGGAWLDTGSIQDFYNTSNFVSTIENRQGFKIACLEEIAFFNNWISEKKVKKFVAENPSSSIADYLKGLIRNDIH